MFDQFKRLRDIFDLGNWLSGWVRKLLTGLFQSRQETFEVERKFNISMTERQTLPAKLRSMGFAYAGQVHMHDQFLPTAVDGDMSRVRDETMDERTIHKFTRKTWVEIAGSRERQEEEEPISPLVRGILLELGLRASDGTLPHFKKDRDMYNRDEGGRTVTVALDLVEGLGEYDGPYMEIEFLVSSEPEVTAARANIYQLAEHILGEKREECKLSYMDMLKRSRSM